MSPSAAGSPSPIPTTRSRRPSRCAHSVAPTASTAPSWLSPASTTGRLRAMLSPRHCPGWPVGWTLPGCRGFRHRPPGHPPRLRLRTPSQSAADTGSVASCPMNRKLPPASPMSTRATAALGCRRSNRSVRRSRAATKHPSVQPNWMPRPRRAATSRTSIEARQRAAADRLAQIRESMRDDSH